MQIVELTQGSPEWHAHRANHFNASDAPAMLGVSPYKSRGQLIREIATGLTAEIDPATQRRFDDGHRFEALARPLAEALIGEGLYPSVGVDGIYSASFDGLTMGESIAWEHKSLNNDIRASIDSGEPLPAQYRVQMEQQLMISGAGRCLFMATTWNSDDELIEERHCWYEPDLELRAKIIAGWEQFEKDVAAYVPEESKPEVIGHAPDQLPALRIEVTGMVTASNLEQFKTAALSVFRGINTSLKTDQDFADAEKAVKFCKDAEERLEAAKAHALSQTASIDDLFKTVDAIKEEARTVRLKLEKLVKSEKESRKGEIITKARAELVGHVEGLHKRIGFSCISVEGGIFAAAIYGLKSLDSMRNKVSVALANAKVEADAIADRIEANRKTVEDMSLFPDFAQVCMKPGEDFAALLAMRIAQRKEAEERRLEAERQRIRAEEEARARAKVAAEQAEANRLAAEAQANAQQAERERVAAELAANRAAEIEPAAKPVVTAEITPIRPVATSSTKPLKLGEISAALGFTVTADFMAHLGLQPSATEKAANLYSVTIATVCRLIQEHLARVMKESLAA